MAEFEQIEGMKDGIYRQLLRMCGNHDDAEDVLVESMLKAYQNLESLREQEAMRAWLGQIARRACGRLKTKERAHPVLTMSGIEFDPAEVADGGLSPEEALLEQETKACVIGALEALPEHYRAAYELVELEGLELEEAADRLGLTVANLKSRLHRARLGIRESLDSIIK